MAPDSVALAEKFSRYLRVTDVCDGLDAVGRADICLMDRSIRPLWMGMRFFGPAVTVRLVPANRHMPVLTREQALDQHSIWGQMGGWKQQWQPLVRPGCVLVTSAGGARECGFWGSNNTMDAQARGVGQGSGGRLKGGRPVQPERCRGNSHRKVVRSRHHRTLVGPRSLASADDRAPGRSVRGEGSAPRRGAHQTVASQIRDFSG